MSDQFEQWRKRLAGEKVPTYDGEPDPGYYREKITQDRKHIGWNPICYYRTEDDEMICVVGIVPNRKIVTPQRGADLWTWVCKYPISEEQYRAVAERGERWHDEPQTSAPPAAKGSVIGDNNPPGEDKPVDPLAEMREKIENAIGAAKDIKVESDEDAARAQGSRARLLELSGQADKAREDEKAPHLKAGKEIDNKYRPLVSQPKEAADAIRTKLTAWENKKRADAAEAERKRLAEVRRVEEENRKAAEAAAAANKPPPEPIKAPEPTPEPDAPKPSTKIGGTYGKAASVQMIKVARVDDWTKAAMHFVEHPDLRAAVQKLCNADMKAGKDVPGVVVIEQADVR